MRAFRDSSPSRLLIQSRMCSQNTTVAILLRRNGRCAERGPSSCRNGWKQRRRAGKRVDSRKGRKSPFRQQFRNGIKATHATTSANSSAVTSPSSLSVAPASSVESGRLHPVEDSASGTRIGSGNSDEHLQCPVQSANITQEVLCRFEMRFDSFV